MYAQRRTGVVPFPLYLASHCVKPDLPHECLGGVGSMDQPRPEKALQQTNTDSHQLTEHQK